MRRREFLAGAALGATELGPRGALAAAEPTMTTVCKIVGVPYSTLLGEGLASAGRQMNIQSTMIGPAHVDPAQRVRLVGDTIAKKVDVLGLIPLSTAFGEAMMKSLARQMGNRGETSASSAR